MNSGFQPHRFDPNLQQYTCWHMSAVLYIVSIYPLQVAHERRPTVKCQTAAVVRLVHLHARGPGEAAQQATLQRAGQRRRQRQRQRHSTIDGAQRHHVPQVLVPVVATVLFIECRVQEVTDVFRFRSRVTAPLTAPSDMMSPRCWYLWLQPYYSLSVGSKR